MDWVAAPWLLTTPASAVMWARNYDRAYPGSLQTLGIPSAALHNAKNWKHWLQAR